MIRFTEGFNSVTRYEAENRGLSTHFTAASNESIERGGIELPAPFILPEASSDQPFSFSATPVGVGSSTGAPDGCILSQTFAAELERVPGLSEWTFQSELRCDEALSPSSGPSSVVELSLSDRGAQVTESTESTEKKKGRWSSDEDNALFAAIRQFGLVWENVAELVPGRSRKQCRDRYYTKLDPSRLKEYQYTEEDIALICRRVALAEEKGVVRPWSEIAQLINKGISERFAEGKSTQQGKLTGHMVRSWWGARQANLRESGKTAKKKPSSRNRSLPTSRPLPSNPRLIRKASLGSKSKRGWSLEEDFALLAAVQQVGARWSLLANDFPGRTAKQCRNRYTEQLDPTLLRSYEFTMEEFDLVKEMVNSADREGRRRPWAKIATRITSGIEDRFRLGRSPVFGRIGPNDIKNWWSKQEKAMAKRVDLSFERFPVNAVAPAIILQQQAEVVAQPLSPLIGKRKRDATLNSLESLQERLSSLDVEVEKLELEPAAKRSRLSGLLADCLYTSSSGGE